MRTFSASAFAVVPLRFCEGGGTYHLERRVCARRLGGYGHWLFALAAALDYHFGSLVGFLLGLVPSINASHLLRGRLDSGIGSCHFAPLLALFLFLRLGALFGCRRCRLLFVLVVETFLLFLLDLQHFQD